MTTVQDVKRYKNADFVLRVNKNYDGNKLDLKSWDRYLDYLSGGREFQKEAITSAIIFLASGQYQTTMDLIEEYWDNTPPPDFIDRFQSIDNYIQHLQLPNKLYATIDLATGTGKSYVIYGIAHIMMGLGLVDKVLVLCPSLTIEEGLTDKFSSLSQDQALMNTIPDNCIIKNPGIKSANVTILKGDICVENIHSVYDRTGSSIKDSFTGQGNRTLILNDECHHIVNKVEGKDKASQSIKKWKEFLLQKDYGFKYILGFTGTAYIENNYFNDVIYRYSLRQAVNDNVVKLVEYVSKNEDADMDVKFQEIYDNHQSNKQFYRKVKPLTILVTRDIKAAKRLMADLADFLVKREELELRIVYEKILIVTSDKEHKLNVRRLKEVDLIDNKIEWIVSVSMLTEGWDVKNVFQIVPWEDRAFNSKLLIAQVLGRGLRIPPEYQTPQPKVRVFNHDAWSRNIEGLVDEILEIELRLVSSPISNCKRKEYHFDIHHINNEKNPIEKISDKKHTEFDYTKGFIEIGSQIEDSEKTTEYRDLYGKVGTKNTLVYYNTYGIEEIANKIVNELKIREWEGKILKLPTGNYSKENLPTREAIILIIKESMKRAGIKGNRLTESNKYKIESAFNTLLRQSGKTVYYEKKYNDPYKISTKSMQKESMSIGSLRRDSTVFYSSEFKKELDKENLDLMIECLADGSFPRDSAKVINLHYFKTPIDLIFTRSKPERAFIEELGTKDNSNLIDGWVKSRDMGFYSIEYSITTSGGKHTKLQSFNPDVFIKVSKNDAIYIIVVEIKDDKDITDENKAKYRHGKQHFEALNKALEERNVKEKYLFHFLSPSSYKVFTAYLKSGELIKGNFISELEIQLTSNPD